ncbi:MAG: hypothetical protein QNJ84_08155 [Alphaproteobacteria bacterium]|nr:hypothetical protein [Alphaproteobacteria bacterium]
MTLQTGLAQSEQLKGPMFVTLARGNTFVGQLPNGVDFHAYFLSGGVATFVDENGDRDTGQWRMRADDALCVTWRRMNPGEERCATLHIEGRKIRLEGNTLVGEVSFTGTIIDGFD